MAEWLVPLSKRSRSFAYDLNVLWRAGTVYVMDNHLAALWCWWQHLRESESWRLFHVDRHTDCMPLPSEWIRALPPEDSSLSDYLHAKYEIGTGEWTPAMQWNNYLSLFFATKGHLVEACYLATSSDKSDSGDDPAYSPTFRVDPWQLLSGIENINAANARDAKVPWIVNLDLDYFTGLAVDQESHIQLFADELIREVGASLARGINSKRIRVLTIALSPETTGSWAIAERLVSVLLSNFAESPTFPPA